MRVAPAVQGVVDHGEEGGPVEARMEVAGRDDPHGEGHVLLGLEAAVEQRQRTVTHEPELEALSGTGSLIGNRRPRRMAGSTL